MNCSYLCISLFVFYRLAFCDHFGGLFGKSKNETICLSLFFMYFLHCSLFYSLVLSFPQLFAITKLNGTNYKQCVKYLMMNLTILKLNLVLKVEAPPKPIAESSTNEKKSYEV